MRRISSFDSIEWHYCVILITIHHCQFRLGAYDFLKFQMNPKKLFFSIFEMKAN